MNNYFIDTHCHININDFEADIDEVIKRAISKNVRKMLVIGCDRISTNKALELADKYDCIRVAAAWHPVDVITCTEEDKLFLLEIWGNQKVVAIGETGLDYHWETSPKPLQQSFFEWHLEMAIALGKPFIIHDRQAHEDVLKTLKVFFKKYGPLIGVLHSYSGSVEMAREFLRLGLYISISGVVTFKNAKSIKEVAVEVPLNRLLIETDAPYLTPMPHRGKRNEPSYVVYVAQEVARLRGQSVEEICSQTTKNAEELFFKR
ncbi:MAG: TatD family hydrolase [Culicoidibacterales bacterium]